MVLHLYRQKKYPKVRHNDQYKEDISEEQISNVMDGNIYDNPDSNQKHDHCHQYLMQLVHPDYPYHDKKDN